MGAAIATYIGGGKDTVGSDGELDAAAVGYLQQKSYRQRYPLTPCVRSAVGKAHHSVG